MPQCPHLCNEDKNTSLVEPLQKPFNIHEVCRATRGTQLMRFTCSYCIQVVILTITLGSKRYHPNIQSETEVQRG